MAGESSTGETGKDIVGSSSGSHVLRDCLRGGSRGGRSWGRVARCALHHVDGISSLDLVCAESLVVLHDAARVDQALPIGGDVLKVFSGELGLELHDGGGLGNCDGVSLIAGALDLEGQFSAAAAGRLGIVGHGDIAKARRGRGRGD